MPFLVTYQTIHVPRKQLESANQFLSNEAANQEDAMREHSRKMKAGEARAVAADVYINPWLVYGSDSQELLILSEFRGS